MRAVALLASAKDRYIDMNRTFSVSGKAVMLMKTKVTDDHEFQDLRWTLSNQHFNSGNVLTLDVTDATTGEVVAHQMWHGEESINMVIREDGKKAYLVYDQDFYHLRILETPIKGFPDYFTIMLFTELRK